MTGIGRAELLLERLHGVEHLAHQLLERVLGRKDLLPFEPEVSPGHRALDHERVGQARELRPLLAKHLGRPPGGDDRDELGARGGGQEAGQVERQAGAAEDEIDRLFDGRLHEIGVMRERHHDVDAQKPARLLARLADLVFQRADVGLQRPGGDVGFAHPDHGGRDDADAAFVGHGRRQAGQGDAHSHAPLDDWNSGGHVADAHAGKLHSLGPSRSSDSAQFRIRPQSFAGVFGDFFPMEAAGVRPTPISGRRSGRSPAGATAPAPACARKARRSGGSPAPAARVPPARPCARR